MKSYNPQIFDAEIWQEIESIFWNIDPMVIVKYGVNGAKETVTDSRALNYFEGEHSFDGLIPEVVITDKEGVTIKGEYSVLPKLKTFRVEILFKKPNFSSIQSVIIKKLRKCVLDEYTVNTIINQTILVLK